MTKTQKHDRDRNRYAGTCFDCNAPVAAGEGRLYRHQGANLTGRLARSRPRRGNRCVYVIRCESCYLAHDKPQTTNAETPWPDPIYAASYAYACGYFD